MKPWHLYWTYNLISFQPIPFQTFSLKRGAACDEEEYPVIDLCTDDEDSNDDTIENPQVAVYEEQRVAMVDLETDSEDVWWRSSGWRNVRRLSPQPLIYSVMNQRGPLLKFIFKMKKFFKIDALINFLNFVSFVYSAFLFLTNSFLYCFFLRQDREKIQFTRY